MSDEDGNYAPRSPDLNAYHVYDQDQFAQQQQGYGYGYQQPQPAGFMTAVGASSYQPPPTMPGAYQYPQIPLAAPPPPLETVPAPTGRGRGRAKKEETPATPPVPVKKRDPVEEGVEVKTKFPVARIKRIMQADEDVGKVAQVSPSLVSKALELFMISLVAKSHAEAKARNARRIQAAHLKAAVEKDEQFDFLTSIVAKIPDAAAIKDEAAGGEEGEGGRRKRKSTAGEGGGRGRGRGRGRAKVESDDE